MGPLKARSAVSRQRVVLVMIAHIFLLCGIIAIGLLHRTVIANTEDEIRFLCWALAGTIAWLVASWRLLGGSFSDAYLLFLAAAALFNGGQCGLEILGLNRNGILDGRFSPETICKTVYLVWLGIASLHCGALAGLRQRRSIARVTSRGREAACRLTGYILIGISLVPAYLTLDEALSVVMSNGYSGLFGRDVPTGFGNTPWVLASFLVPGLLFALAGSRGRRKAVIGLAAIVALYAAGYFFMGCRGAAVMALAAFAWLYHQCIRRVPRTVIVASALFLLFLLPLIAGLRTTAGEWRLSADAIRQQIDAAGTPLPIAAVAEIGRSMMTISYTLDLVPAVRALDYGASYCWAALTLIPNVGWDVHPTNSHVLLADWLVRTTDPSTAGRGGGLGFSFMAEAYLNFGWAGLPFALGLIGWGLSRLFHWAESSGDPARKAVLASFLSFFLLYARGESAVCVRALAWYSFLPYLCVCALTRWHPSPARRPVQPASLSPEWRPQIGRHPGITGCGHGAAR